MSAGPVDEGKIPNPYECIVCDPDKKWAEGKALGLLYTAISRATTLGDNDGLNSAIYFEGKDFNRERLTMMGKRKDTCDDYIRIKLRRVWVEFINQHTTHEKFTETEMNACVEWATDTTYSYETLWQRIKHYVHVKASTRPRKKYKHQKKQKRWQQAHA